MVSPAGFAKAVLIQAGQRAAFIAFLNEQLLDPQLRRYLLIGWAKETGVQLSAADYEAIGFPSLLSSNY